MSETNSKNEFLYLNKENTIKDPKSLCEIVLIYEKNPVFREMIELILEENFYSVTSNLNFENMDDKIK